MKMKDFGFYRGVDLGGWFSQCDYSDDRMDHFITERDFNVIAGWGLDHVRLPVDYNVVLDLHKTAGFSFDAGEKQEGFFDNESLQNRFYRLWEEMAMNFTDAENVAFELLNEVTDQNYICAWNRISGECIRRIRKTAPESLILIGSYHNNAPYALKDLESPADKRVIYNFHCYDPVQFTHQGAYWVPQLDRNARVSFEEAGVDEGFFEKIY